MAKRKKKKMEDKDKMGEGQVVKIQGKKSSFYDYQDAVIEALDSLPEESPAGFYSEELWLTGKRPIASFTPVRGRMWYEVPKKLCVEMTARPAKASSKKRKTKKVVKQFVFLVDPVDLGSALMLAMNERRGLHKTFMGYSLTNRDERWVMFPAWSLKPINKESMAWIKLKQNLALIGRESSNEKIVKEHIRIIQKKLIPKIERRIGVSPGINIGFKRVEDMSEDENDLKLDNLTYNLFIQGISFLRVINWFRDIINSYDDTRVIGGFVVVRKGEHIGLAGSNSPILKLSYSQRDKLKLSLERLINTGAVFGFNDGDLSFGKLRDKAAIYDNDGASVYIKGRRVPVGSAVNAASLLMCL